MDMESRFHNCSGTDMTLNFIRYSPGQMEWLFCTEDNGEHVIYYCPYCGVKLEEI